jgi:hypothetical protein
MSCIENLYPRGRNWNPPGPIAPWRCAARRGGNACARGHGRRLHLDPGHLVDEAGCGLRAPPASASSVGEGPPSMPVSNRGRPAFIRRPGTGTLLPIAIGWMMCRDGHPPPTPSSCLSRKTAIRSPRRQRPLYQGSRAPCRSPPVRLRPSRSQPSGFATSERRTRGSPAPRRPVADRMGAAGTPLSLVDRLLPARGRHRGFRRARWWRDGAEIRGAQIHLIAIRGSRPRWEAGASDEHPPVRCATPCPERAESSSGRHDPEHGPAALRRAAGTGTRTRPGAHAGG